jgi:ribosome-binding factor A
VKHTAEKLAQEIRARLAEILRERVGDPRLEGVSISEVRVAPDASFARIFWGSLGDADAAAEALEKAKPYIRRCLAGELRVRRVPELDFRRDETPDRARRVEGVLRELERERAAKTEEEPG